MMNLVPPVGWGDVATTRDHELHRAETKHDLLELRTAEGAELAATRHESARAGPRRYARHARTHPESVGGAAWLAEHR